MDRAHTKGPWRATRDCFGDFTIQPHDEELAIAAVVNGEMRRMGGLLGKHEANARLIAAAPEMFEALDEVAAAFSEGVAWTGTQRKAYELVRLALAKAEWRANLADANPNPSPTQESGR